jgi:starch synthase (maltosyl-transferring)
MVEDLLTGVSYTWHDRWNYVALKPESHQAHVFRIHGRAVS